MSQFHDHFVSDGVNLSLITQPIVFEFSPTAFLGGQTIDQFTGALALKADKSEVDGLNAILRADVTALQTADGLKLNANDPAVTNARTPTAHALTHLTLGGDPIPTATPSSAGLLTGLSGNANDYLGGDGLWHPAITGFNLSQLQADITGKLDKTDPAVTNARFPMAHAASHLLEGSDPLRVATPSEAGYMPRLSGNATDVLCGDAVFRPRTGGDMLASVYDANHDGVVDTAASVLWAGITGRPVTFPPTGHGASHLFSGTDPIPLATVGNAGMLLALSGDVNTVLRGNLTWGTVAATGGDMLKSVYDPSGSGIVGRAAQAPWSGLTGIPVTFPPGAHSASHLSGGTDILPNATLLSSGALRALSGNPTDYFGGDGNWHVVSAGGDMQSAVYDPTRSGTVLTATSVPWAGIQNRPVSFTPTSHASSHSVSGSDPISVTLAQVVTLSHNVTDYLSGTGIFLPVPSVDPALYGQIGYLQSQSVQNTNDISYLQLQEAGPPNAHAVTHGVLGTDPIPLADTLGNAGLCPPLDGQTVGMDPVTGLLGVTGINYAAIGNLPVTFPASPHAAAHEAGGIDPIPLDLLALPFDSTTLNTSVQRHGLFPKLPGSVVPVSLAWDASTSSGVVGYKIHYGTTSGVYPSLLDVGNVLAALVYTLTPGVTYYFAITDYDSVGNQSGYSNELSVLTVARSKTYFNSFGGFDAPASAGGLGDMLSTIYAIGSGASNSVTVDHALYADAVTYANVTGKPAFGTASLVDVPASGDAASGQAVKGSDTRLAAVATNTANIATNASAITALQTRRLDQFAAPNVSLSLGSQKITNLLTPTLSTDAVTKAYTDSADTANASAITANAANITANATAITALQARRLDQFAAPNVSLSMGSQKITNLLTPTLSTDAVTKAYTDSADTANTSAIAANTTNIATNTSAISSINADARWTDARTPAAHKSTHITGGSDVILAPTTSASGLVPILPSSSAAAKFLNGLAAFAVVDYTQLSSVPSTFAPVGHQGSHITGGGDIIPVATSSATGLVPILSNVASQFLTGTGTWATPAGGGDMSKVTYDTVNRGWVDRAVLADSASAVAYANVTGKPAFGTASLVDVPASGDAASGQAVKGSDTRLAAVATNTASIATINADSRWTNARTPTAHASTHAAAGSDPLTLTRAQISDFPASSVFLASVTTAFTCPAAGATSGSIAVSSTALMSSNTYVSLVGWGRFLVTVTDGTHLTLYNGSFDNGSTIKYYADATLNAVAGTVPVGTLILPTPYSLYVHASGSYTVPIPNGLTYFRGSVISGGGPGGGGCSGLNTVARSGGGGGAGGGRSERTWTISSLGGTSISLVVGVGGAGGAGGLIAGASGSVGGIPGGSTVTVNSFVILRASGVGRGLGGTSTAVTGGSTQPAGDPGGAGGAGQLTAGTVGNAPGGGGGGGGLNTSNAAGAGAAGASGSPDFTVTAGGAGGAATGVNGTAGANSPDNVYAVATAGGGGGANSSGNGGNGGNGGYPGGGGGGGGGGASGFVGGDGGAGAAGAALLYFY